MSETAVNHPHQTREDRYFEALEDFLRTSAGYFEIDEVMPGQGMPRDRCDHTVRGDALR